MGTVNKSSGDELAHAWVRRFSRERKRVLTAASAESQLKVDQQIDAETIWAFDALENLIAKEPSGAWAMILRILDIAEQDEDVLNNLAAGPLESLLARHGRAVIKWVEEEARRNTKFKELLGGVWQNAIPELIWQRVQRAAEVRG